MICARQASPKIGVVGVFRSQYLLPRSDTFLRPIILVIQNVILDLMSCRIRFKQRNADDVEKLRLLAALVSTLFLGYFMRRARTDGPNPVGSLSIVEELASDTPTRGRFFRIRQANYGSFVHDFLQSAAASRLLR